MCRRIADRQQEHSTVLQRGGERIENVEQIDTEIYVHSCTRMMHMR